MRFDECEQIIISLADRFPGTLTYYGKGICALRCDDGLSQILYFIRKEGTLHAELPIVRRTDGDGYERVKRDFTPATGETAPALREQIVAFMLATLLEYQASHYHSPPAR